MNAELEQIWNRVRNEVDRRMQGVAKPASEAPIAAPQQKERDEGRVRRMTEISEEIKAAGVQPGPYLDSVEELIEHADGLRRSVGILPGPRRAKVSRAIARGIEKELSGE